jgi:hypothetical protein
MAKCYKTLYFVVYNFDQKARAFATATNLQPCLMLVGKDRSQVESVIHFLSSSHNFKQ